MAYRLPVFHLDIAIWRFGSDTDDPPDAACLGNLAFGRRFYSGDNANVPFDPAALPVGFLLCPKGSDIRGDVDTDGEPDTVEIPDGSGAFWRVHWVHPIALGFDNEHVCARVTPLTGTTPPPEGSHIITEGSDPIATEGSDLFIVE